LDGVPEMPGSESGGGSRGGGDRGGGWRVKVDIMHSGHTEKGGREGNCLYQ
jgi:hypothetical protein